MIANKTDRCPYVRIFGHCDKKETDNFIFRKVLFLNVTYVKIVTRTYHDSNVNLITM